MRRTGARSCSAGALRDLKRGRMVYSWRADTLCAGPGGGGGGVSGAAGDGGRLLSKDAMQADVCVLSDSTLCQAKSKLLLMESICEPTRFSEAKEGDGRWSALQEQYSAAMSLGVYLSGQDLGICAESDGGQAWERCVCSSSSRWNNPFGLSLYWSAALIVSCAVCDDSDVKD